MPPRPRSLARLSAPVLLAALVSCDATAREGGPPGWKGAIDDTGPVPVVRSPAEPLAAADQVRARALWTIPAGDDAGTPAWERPTRLAVGGEHVYVLDEMARRVRVVTRAGEPRGAFGRRGGGPGEFEQPFGIAFVGGVVAVGDAGKGRIEVFDSGGRYLRSIGVRGTGLSLAALGSDRLLVGAFAEPGGAHKVYGLAGGVEPVSIPEPPGEKTGAGCSRVTSGERYILQMSCASPHFQVLSERGEPLRVVGIDRSPVRSSPAELARVRALIRGELAKTRYPPSRADAFVERSLEDYRVKRRMRGITFDPGAGRFAIWEQEPAELGNGPASLHLLAGRGEFLATVRFPEAWVDFAVRDSVVYALAEDPETGLVSLRAYEIRLDPAPGATPPAPDAA